MIDLNEDTKSKITFNDAFKVWCRVKDGRIVSYEDERQRLEKYIVAPLGHLAINQINTPLIIKTISHLEDAGKYATLKRCLMRTREIMDLAVCCDYVDRNPIGKVSMIFTPAIPKHMPAINWKELPEAMDVIATASKKIQLLFLWSATSILRPGEVVKIRKSWIKDNVLTIPALEMKHKTEHRVPLTDYMLKILEESKKVYQSSNSEFIFAAKNDSRHIYSQTLAKFLCHTSLRGRLVAHGLRSVARSWMADHSVPFEVAEQCLSHVVGSRATRSYQRSDYLEIRREIMNEWCDYIMRCAKNANVMPELC